MCGILAILGDASKNQELEDLCDLIDRRGPDFQSPFICHNLKCGLKLKLKAAVLHLRGDALRKQPVIDETGNVLLFNGQIYEFDGNTLPEQVSDTSFLLERLESCKSKIEVAETFSRIDGPFAFIYWNDNLDALFYGRDFFGRKSLCLLREEDSLYPAAISSVSKRKSNSRDPSDCIWQEVNCSGFHCLEYTKQSIAPIATRFMWKIDEIYPPTSRCQTLIDGDDIEHIFLQKIPLAPLNDDMRLHRQFELDDIKTAVSGLERRFVEAVQKRIRYNKKTCFGCRRSSTSDTCTHSKVSIAFSGGIDSTLIALAVDKVLDAGETIDLLTVAFKDDSPDRSSVGSAYREIRQLCPNRNWRLILSDITLSNLQSDRADVISDLIAPCSTVVDDSLGCGCWYISRGQGRSLDSLMDDSEFEKTFESFLKYNSSNEANDAYTSPATMFFAGMSIDEQLGGYSSHRAAWSRAGTKGVFEEVSMLMRRISTRNLGRDDRCCSHHGRDVKFPYLDFNLVSYLNQLPIGLKMNLDEPIELGPKKLLRELAFRWGLSETGRRTKRALQFGTRIANLEHPKERGNDICSRLT